MVVEQTKTGKMRVGVIMGGISSEKEVSLESGRNIFSKIDRKEYEPLPIFMDSRGLLWEIPIKLLMRNSTGDVEADLETEARRLFYEDLKGAVDFVYIGLHGKYGEDGCLQGVLELLKVPYAGSGVLGSALGADKYVSRKILAMSGLDVPRTEAVSLKEWGKNRDDIIGHPVFLLQQGDERRLRVVFSGTIPPKPLSPPRRYRRREFFRWRINSCMVRERIRPPRGSRRIPFG